METGNIVEYIDQQKITCAVVLEVKKQRLRLLTETDREVNLSENRLSHRCQVRLDPDLSRHKMVATLKEIADRRKALISHVDIKEVWEVLNTEQEWIDLATMTEFCFPDSPTHDHESAVVRAFFKNRLYFKFNTDRFYPYTEEQVGRLFEQQKENERKNRIIALGSDWVKKIRSQGSDAPKAGAGELTEVVDILKSTYYHGKTGKNYQVGKAILEKAGIKDSDEVLPILVKAGLWDENVNVDLVRLNIQTDFSEKVHEAVEKLETATPGVESFDVNGHKREDLTDLPVMTIDGQSTLDFDDALSIEHTGDSYQVGVHIIDVGHYVKKGDVVDRAAEERGSSIYLPDARIPMLPPGLAENTCSLKLGEKRPAISIMIQLNGLFDITDYNIFLSVIRVDQQLSYYEANNLMDENNQLKLLHGIALKFRQWRLSEGALQITLPEINVWVGDDGEILVNRVNRESPGRMLVSELMIMANWMMADFLARHRLPAIFRAQAPPRERLIKDNEGSLFQNCMQRRYLSRFHLNSEPGHHSGLGLDKYVTATSPIRKYFDLVTQRQIRSVFGLDKPYAADQIDRVIQELEQPMNNVSRIQYLRSRYWILKYLEKKIGTKEEAIVLFKRRKKYQILISKYMLECELPDTSGLDLKPEDLISITIQHVNARKDLLSVYVG